LEFWRSYFGISEQDTARAARDKIAGRMVLLDETLAYGLPLMFDFLGVPDPERPAPPLGAEARGRQFFEVVRRLARARSAREPAVLLFEDLHWFDRASDDYIENIVVENAPGNRTLLLLNFRPEYHARSMQRSYYQRLALLPLGPKEIKELFADLLGGDPSLQRLRELIQERTGGNPFFIEEIVQSLIETGVLAGTRGAYRLVKPADVSYRQERGVERESSLTRPGSQSRRCVSTPRCRGRRERESALNRAGGVSAGSERDIDIRGVAGRVHKVGRESPAHLAGALLRTYGRRGVERKRLGGRVHGPGESERAPDLVCCHCVSRLYDVDLCGGEPSLLGCDAAADRIFPGAGLSGAGGVDTPQPGDEEVPAPAATTAATERREQQRRSDEHGRLESSMTSHLTRSLSARLVSSAALGWPRLAPRPSVLRVR
jgi:hypothetical protein